MKIFVFAIQLLFLFPLQVWSDSVGNELRDSPPKINKDFERATRLTKNDISKLREDSEELYNAYKQVLLTDSLAEDNNPGKLPSREVSSANWANLVKEDMIRRGAAAQPVVEKIFVDSGGYPTTLLRKIEFLPQIDKRPFVKWVREFLEECVADEMRNPKLSQLADFIAKHGTLDDLEFLERLAQDVPLDDPGRLRLIKSRKQQFEQNLLGKAESAESVPQKLRNGVTEKDVDQTRSESSRDSTFPSSTRWPVAALVVAAVLGLALLIRAFLRGRAS